VALAAIGWKYYVMFIVLDVCELVIAYFLVLETKGLTLEDIAVLFDGEDAHVLAIERHEDKVDEKDAELAHQEVKY